MTVILDHTVLNEDQLKKAIETMLDRLLPKMNLTRDQENEFQNRKEELINQLYLSLRSKNKSDISFEQLNSPDFIKRLFVNVVTTLLIEKHFDKNFTDELINNLKKLNPEFKLDPSKIKNPKDLEKLLNDLNIKPEDLNKILTPAMIKKLNDFLQEANDLLKQANGNKHTPLETKPEMGKGKTDKLSDSNDPYENLFGLICSNIPGGLPVVVQYNWGNGNSLPDWNPHHGTAQIDQQNKIDDTLFGDPLGLNAETVSNYLAEEAFGGDLVEGMRNEIRSVPSTPRLNPYGSQQ